jgi:hypothetical protein
VSYSGRCGQVTETQRVWMSGRGTPAILGMEVTQGIQRFKLPWESWKGADRSQWNTLEIIAQKPTVVRVYVAVNHARDAKIASGFQVTGTLRLLHPVTHQQIGPSLSPLYRRPDGVLLSNAHVIAAAPTLMERERSNESLNFLIPAGLATGELELRATVEVVDGYGIGATASQSVRAKWRTKSSLNVHYVRVYGYDPKPLSDAEARKAVESGLQVLPYPVLRVAAAPTATIGVYEHWIAHDGDEVLVDKLIELSEDIDDTRYIGVVNTAVPSPGISGRATTCETTCWATREPIVVAHEVAHQLCLRHVYPVGADDDVGLDVLPDEGAIHNTPFDIERMTTVNDLAGTDALWDFMRVEAPTRTQPEVQRPLWISEFSWARLAKSNDPW